jgi:hypothetical protein
VTSFVLDASSLVDPPSVSFHAHPNAQKNKKSHGVKDGCMSGACADFAANVDLSKQSDDPWAVSWGDLAAEPKKTDN